MTIETKFSLEDEVWWATTKYSGSGIIKNVDVNVCKNGTRTSYRVYIPQSGIHLIFSEQELFATREEWSEHLRKTKR
jgi:hypothetical protein